MALRALSDTLGKRDDQRADKDAPQFLLLLV